MPKGKKQTKAGGQLTREQALSAKPLSNPILGRKELPDGGARITVRYTPTKWQRILLRVGDAATRKYELDAFGVEILGMCDGQKTVRYIAEKFAKSHQLNKREAEQAVVTFLQMMMRKGIISVIVPRA